jgi:hypothetical protein
MNSPSSEALEEDAVQTAAIESETLDREQIRSFLLLTGKGTKTIMQP